MTVIAKPTKPGFYWWRRDEKSEWKLAQIELQTNDLVARFFNGSRMSWGLWGEFVEVEIPKPILETT